MFILPSKLYNLCLALEGSTESSEASIIKIQQWLSKNKKNHNLLKKAANYRGKFYRTPLHLIVAARPPSDLVENLLQLGQDTVKLQAIDGRLPLHFACIKPSASVVSILLQAYPEAAGVQDKKNGDLPLHLACSYKAAPEIMTMLIAAYLKGPEVQNKYGRLPLHFACGNDSSSDVVAMLLDVYPKGAAVQDKFGKLPLHWACEYGVSLEVLDLLLIAYPEGIDIRERSSNRKPSELLREQAKCNYGHDYKFLLQKAVIGRFSEQLVKLLLQAFPESGTEMDENGMVPLHYACLKKPADILINVVLSLLEANPCLSTMPNDDGKNPYQLLKEAALEKDENGMILMHHVSMSSKEFTVKDLNFLVTLYPESLILPDKNRMLPIHHACLNPSSSLDVLMHFIQLYPESIFRSL